jgi:uncharacterized DUF497 family protein
LATTVFQDPLSLTIVDDEDSDHEERWITLGRAATEVLVVVVHTWLDGQANAIRVRIISARLATATERQQYQG